MENDYQKVDQALEALSQREWRTPSIEQITTKEFAMNKFSQKMSRTKLALLIGGIAVIGTGAAFGAAYSMGAFNGRIVTDDGRAYDVQMTETGEGVYEGTTSDGHQVQFITEKAEQAQTVELNIESPESGTFTFSGEPGAMTQQWTTSEETETDSEEATEESDQD